MSNQRIDPDSEGPEVLNVRWANDDPNPAAQRRRAACAPGARLSPLALRPRRPGSGPHAAPPARPLSPRVPLALSSALVLPLRRRQAEAQPRGDVC